MKRNFSNWLDAYCEYARDEYCPDEFHLWTGLSLIAASAERKVWINPANILIYPNIFVLLTSHAGVGKSTALERGVDLFEELKVTVNPNLMVIPNQATEPGLLDLMKIRSAITIGSTTTWHSSGYFYASEASASALQNTAGSFTSTITAFYDCPRVFRKKLKMDKDVTEIFNSCFNVLAGSTFEYLKTLVDTKSVMGGFASRFVYVVSKDRPIRDSRWDVVSEEKRKFRAALIEDLGRINSLIGRLEPTEGFKQRWEEYQPNFDRFLIGLNSPRLESLFARKATNLTKVAMLMSLAESDSLVLNENHWERALKHIEDAYSNTAFVLSQSLTANNETQAGLSQFILEELNRGKGTMQMKDLKRSLIRYGSDFMRFDSTMTTMREAGLIDVQSNNNGFSEVKLLVDPNSNL